MALLGQQRRVGREDGRDGRRSRVRGEFEARPHGRPRTAPLFGSLRVPFPFFLLRSSSLRRGSAEVIAPYQGRQLMQSPATHQPECTAVWTVEDRAHFD